MLSTPADRVFHLVRGRVDGSARQCRRQRRGSRRSRNQRAPIAAAALLVCRAEAIRRGTVKLQQRLCLFSCCVFSFPAPQIILKHCSLFNTFDNVSNLVIFYYPKDLFFFYNLRCKQAILYIFFVQAFRHESLLNCSSNSLDYIHWLDLCLPGQARSS